MAEPNPDPHHSPLKQEESKSPPPHHSPPMAKSGHYSGLSDEEFINLVIERKYEKHRPDDGMREEFQSRLFSYPFLKSLFNTRERILGFNALVDYSVFKPSATSDLDLMGTFFKGKGPYYESSLTRRAVAGMTGMALADSLGHLTEFTPVKYREKKSYIITDFNEEAWMSRKVLNQFRLKPGQYTDDTSMGLCMAESLIAKQRVDLKDMRVRFYLWWNGGYCNAFRFDSPSRSSVGLGGIISHSLEEIHYELEDFTKMGNEKSSGVGSIMRLAPVPLFFAGKAGDPKGMDEAIEASANSSYTTHQGTEAADCCRLMAWILLQALHNNVHGRDISAKQFLDGLRIEDILPKLKTESAKCIAKSISEDPKTFMPDKFNKEPKDRNWNWKDVNFKYSPTRAKQQPGYIGSYAPDALAMALHIVYHSASFKEAILWVVNWGGDADSVGAVVGQIAGAIYGLSSIPRDWMQFLWKWDNFGEVALRAILLVNNEDEDLRRSTLRPEFLTPLPKQYKILKDYF